MGPCASGTAVNVARKKPARYDIEPEDTRHLEGLNLPILDFYGLLTDIKSKKCGLESIGFRFFIQGITKLNCPNRKNDSKQKTGWKVNHLFDFRMTEYHLRKKFLVVEAVGPNLQVIGSLKINIYTIWKGPFHQDFKMVLGNSPNNICRVSFNFRLSQGLHMKLYNTLTQIVPQIMLANGTRLTFTMEAIIGQKTQPSSFAHHVCIDQRQGMSKGLLGDFPAARNVKKNSIQWQRLQGHQKMPSFSENIPYYQMYSSSMLFTFWRVEPGIIDPSEPRYESEGSCFIPISKLLDMDYTVQSDEVTGISYQNRQVELKQKLWHHGVQMGVAHLKFKFLMQAHQKQMQSCVRTQDGILTSTPVFTNFAGQDCAQITQLNQINIQIQKEFINLDDAAEQRKQFKQMKELVLRIHNLLEKELGLLRQTNKESILIYTYQSQDDLLKGQRMLIFFAFKVLSYIREDVSYIKATCWQILIAILQRGEFKLSHLGFSQEEKAILRQEGHNQHTKFKKEIALKYLQLLNQLLKQTLRSLQYKGIPEEQLFAERFCAYAYFRLPLFRQKILEILKEQKDPQVPEWRGTEANLYEETNERKKTDDFYSHMFDWENNFLLPLSHNERYHSFVHTLQILLQQQRWRLRLARRQTAFYHFLQNLIEEIEYVSVISKHIRWHCLPGYNKLLHVFLSQMKNTKIKAYSQSFRSCSLKLLANQKLLNVMVVLLLSRSNVNDPETVAVSFYLIDQFFRSIKNNKLPIPGTFDYKYLLKGIRVVLDSDFEASISKVLLFLYDNFSNLSEQFGLQLALYLMTTHFYRFFFHWSFNLRHIFQMFVFTKVSQYETAHTHQLRRNNSQSNYISSLRMALRRRYQNLLVELTQEIQPSAPTYNINRFFDKELYRKMQIKLTRARKGHHLRQSKSLYQDISQKLQYLFNPSKEEGSVKYQRPKKLLYFLEDELQLKTIKAEQIGYVKIGLAEYNEIVTNIRQTLMIDPNYTPEIKIRRINDESDLFQTQQEEEW